MARCEDIELLLGPFEDGELEPHEMREVARHAATCAACDTLLNDYRSMGVALRGAQPVPNLDKFASGVMARIERMHLPPPVPELKRHWYDTVSDWFANIILTGGLAGAVAVATALVITPELSRYLHHPAANAQHSAGAVSQLALRGPLSPPVSKAPTAPPPSINSADKNNQAPPAISSDGADQLAEVGDGGTVISQLQSDSPSVAVWTAPDNKTTVVWIPDQQP